MVTIYTIRTVFRDKENTRKLYNRPILISNQTCFQKNDEDLEPVKNS